jgi:predicted outer membrane repeat protein
LKETNILFNPFPKQQEFLEAVFSNNYSFVLFGGAIRGGKTFALLGLFILLSKLYPGSRWAIVRKDLQVIKKNLFPSWDKIKPTNFIKNHNHETQTVTFINNSQIIFFPESYATDKDLDRWKGLEVNGIGFEEINECKEVSLFKAFERAGAYVIPNAVRQPKPIVVGTCNPTQGWVKTLIYDPWKSGAIKKTWHYIQSRIYDNLPLLEQQPAYLPSLKDNLNRYEYEVFVEGNWDIQLKTGGEFLKGFELTKHVRPVEIDLSKVIHLSIDSNVYPYISVTAWQLIKGQQWGIIQVNEICAEDPNNTARKAGELTGKWLQTIGYKQKIMLYGDRSTKNRNNIDDDKRSFAQIFTDALKKSGYKVEDKFLNFAPPVSNIADFVNAIFDGTLKFAEITIGEHCKKSINDYIETKQDRDGTMLKKRETNPKTGVSFEPNGHLTDTIKDFITQAFYDEFIKFQNRFTTPKPFQVQSISRQSKITY